jgi:hypothetical protein
LRWRPLKQQLPPPREVQLLAVVLVLVLVLVLPLLVVRACMTNDPFNGRQRTSLLHLAKIGSRALWDT